ncbi:ABC transporter substrate-binding protein [Paenibacillus sanguinis]|uniref:ABC transporter substrate-binding protein n=1 Tax=Paenibacillus sanguinis TaxID=225906 RepID=UPI00037ACFAC|nr:ABC transporter substrate-binding protein [Paenibacillus sanguinis]
MMANNRIKWWKRRLSLAVRLTLILAVLLSVSSCGLPDKGHHDPLLVGEGPDAAPVEISITYAMGDSAHQKGMQTMINNYKKSHLNVQIKVIGNTYQAKGYADDLTLLDAMGTFPDLVEMRDTQMFADAGLLAELPASVQQLFNDIPQVNGKIYTAPIQAELPQGIIYNQRLFEELGLKEPSTYAEFLEICETIKQAGISPIIVGGRDLWHMGFWINHFLLDDVYADDSEWNRKRNEGLVKWTDAGPSAALKDLKELWDKEYVAPGFLNVSDSQTVGYLTAGKAAMLMSGPWMFTQLKELDPYFKIGFFPVPDREGNIHITGLSLPTGWAISAQAAEDPAKLRTIEQFLHFFYSAEEYSKYLTLTSALPATKAPVQLEADLLVKEVQTLLADPHVIKLRSMENHWGANQIPPGFRNELYAFVQDYLSGHISIQQALEQADEAWDTRDSKD